jgi:hypothetical protein
MAMTDSSTQDEGLVRPRKRRRGPVLRPVNVTTIDQAADHAHCCGTARDSHELRYADRDPNGDALQRVNQRFYDMGPALPEPKPRDISSSSSQGVVTFRTVTQADLTPPEMRHIFTAEELDAIVEEDQARDIISADSYRHVDRIPDSKFASLVGFQTAAQERGQIVYEERKRKRAEKLQRRAEREEKKRQAEKLKQAGHKVATPLVAVDEHEAKKAQAEAEKRAEHHRSKKQARRDRCLNGFLLAKQTKIADDFYEPFHEFFGPNILRSRLGSPSLARMAQIYPRRGMIRAGYDKTYVLPTESKLDALDAPYVELDSRFMRIVVKEFDIVASSAGAFRRDLLTVLPPEMQPNLVVGRSDRSGHFARMHCIWVLDPAREIEQEDGTVKTVDCCVWNDLPREWTDPLTGEVHKSGDARCQSGPIEKYWQIDRALTKLLLPLGCDPAFTNVWKPKGPLSPFWTTVINNDDKFFALDDFTRIPGFDPTVTKEDLEREATAMREAAAKAAEAARRKAWGEEDEGDAGEVENAEEVTALTPSDLTWKTVGAVVRPLCGLMLELVGALRRRSDDKRPRVREIMEEDSFLEAAKAGRDELAQWFDKRVRPKVVAELGDLPGVDRVIVRRCDFVARYCLGKLFRKRGAKKNRGRDNDRKLVLVAQEDGTERLLTPKERKDEAGQRTAARRRAVSLWNLRKEMAVALWATGEIRKTEFIKSLGTMRKSAAYELWDEAIATLSTEFRDGSYRYTARSLPASSNNSSTPSVAMQTLVDVLDAASAPTTPALIIDPDLIEPGDGPPQAGVREHRGQRCASGNVGMPLDVVLDEPEFEPA